MNIVFFTGSGISAESGIQTFREAGKGLWENFRIEDVCTHEAMLFNRKVVVEFYNNMRRQLLTKQPNAGHTAIAELQKEEGLNVQIITQNVDDLHERSGATHITHLHGELMKLRSSNDEQAWISPADRPDLFEDGWEQQMDDRHPDGSLLRPFIVFFGENVPEMEKAIEITMKADFFVVVGSSLAVYPAASLLQFVPPHKPIVVIDPNEPEIDLHSNTVFHIRKPATEGVPEVCETIRNWAKGEI